jgi:bifunctional non-homologous end joining protein LigD
MFRVGAVSVRLQESTVALTIGLIRTYHGHVAAPSKTGARPSFVVPMAAQPVTALPEGPDWLYELKLDGYRALLIKDGSRLQIRSRNDKDLARVYPRLVAAAQELEADQVVLDGEVTALGPDGRPAFQALQHPGSNPSHMIVFYAFDVLHLNGRTVMGEPLERRRARLPAILEGVPNTIRLSQELPGAAADVVRAVEAAGLEGVIAKRRSSSYQPGERSSDWLKLKLEKQQEFVIGGYRADGAKGVDALLVGYYAGRELRFAGKVRAGMVPHVRRERLRTLKQLGVEQCPFVNLPDATTGRWGGGVTAEDMAQMTWLTPVVVAQIRFQEWTADGRLRHAKYLGLREDKAARDVHRES